MAIACWVAPAGEAAFERLAAHRAGLAELLAGWSAEQHAELAALLNRLARALAGAAPF